MSECTGDDIWSIEHCETRRVPQPWIDELRDCFESGFEAGFRESDETIFVDISVVNQYEGVRDVDLAVRIGEFLKLDVDCLRATSPSRAALVRAIREAAEEQ
ncbi:MAG: hypothetical protein AAGG44_04855 [Planctomycetota bacterium]